MTIVDIKQSSKELLTPSEISQVIHCNPQALREQAKKDASKLGFPVVIIGNRTYIPRLAFLGFLGEISA